MVQRITVNGAQGLERGVVCNSRVWNANAACASACIRYEMAKCRSYDRYMLNTVWAVFGTLV